MWIRWKDIIKMVIRGSGREGEDRIQRIRIEFSVGIL
jgi:hypothetical protein